MDIQMDSWQKKLDRKANKIQFTIVTKNTFH